MLGSILILSLHYKFESLEDFEISNSVRSIQLHSKDYIQSLPMNH